ncbi:MAG TPA: histidine kinase dimerization/phospho-acceptor domain-containing protein, partial [Planctomycetota bacterium]|nr:histidine kinase dimerization/phospho-acceptor domain-containing protein [Planctomycetota bacterium]
MSTCDDRRLRDLAVLGHELRNPLAAALTGVATAAAITPAGDARAALLERACRDLDRLGKLLDAYLVLLGGKGPGAAPVDLASLARAVAARRGVATVAFRAGSESLPVTGSAVL